jgi:hypothetical protein
MTRHLQHRATGAILPYPRQDDEPVVGIDRTAYHVLEEVREPRPTATGAQQVLPADPVVAITDPDGDDLNGTITYGWVIVTPPPPPPVADWLAFAGWLYQFPPIAAGMDAARLSTDPQGEPATTGLPTALDEARLRQNYPAFSLTWGLFLLASGMAPEALGAIVAKASECNLPAEFITALQPTPPA